MCIPSAFSCLDNHLVLNVSRPTQTPSGEMLHRYQIRPNVFVERVDVESVPTDSVPPDEMRAHLARECARFFTLHHAAYFDKLKEVQGLLARGADKDQKDPTSGDTPLIMAAKAGNEAVVDTLCQSGADVNRRGAGDLSPLHHACRHGSLKIVSALLRAKANLEAEDLAGNTAIMYCCRMGHAKVLELLLASGANMHHTNSAGVSCAVIAAVNAHVLIIEILLRNGLSINRQDKDGNTLLHIASMLGYGRMVSFLLGLEAPLPRPNTAGQTHSQSARPSSSSAFRCAGVDVRLTNCKNECAADVACSQAIRDMILRVGPKS